MQIVPLPRVGGLVPDNTDNDVMLGCDVIRSEQRAGRSLLELCWLGFASTYFSLMHVTRISYYTTAYLRYAAASPTPLEG